MKKIGFLFLSLFIIFGFGVSLANPIAVPSFVKEKDICYKLKNLEIDDYKVIIERGNRNANSLGGARDGREREVYELRQNECTKCSNRGSSTVYLLDKNIDINSITTGNIENMTIFVGNIPDSDCTPYYDETRTYEIVSIGGKYQLGKEETKTIKNIKKLILFWLGAIMLETIVLFIIAKLSRKEENIPNWKLVLYGILPTTITLPFLWFVLPLILGKGIRYVIIGELLVTIIEAIMIKYGLKISRGKATIASIVCNIASYGLGLLIL